MTILFTESSKNLGGQERRLIFEARALQGAGHKVGIACPADSALYKRALSEGIAVHAVKMRASLHLPSLWALARLVVRLKPDVLYSHSGKDSWVAGITGLVTGVPVVRSRELLTPVKSRHAYTLCRRVLACSGAVKKQLVEAGVPARKVFVQYPPVDTARFSSAGEGERERVSLELGLAGHYPVIFCAGGFRGEKRQEDLVRALALLLPEFPDALLVLAGDGRNIGFVRKLAQDMDIADRVLFPGEREDVPAILSVSDIYAFPSDKEPFGMGPVEAMAAGVPVVVSRTGGLVEIVDDGKYGMMFPPRNVDELAGAIAKIAGDTVLRKRLSAEGKRRALYFDSRAAMERLERHFNDIIRK
jgi:glycosyltransferase involved in cell wall biosynthesis